jgi:hypothetical protein
MSASRASPQPHGQKPWHDPLLRAAAFAPAHPRVFTRHEYRSPDTFTAPSVSSLMRSPFPPRSPMRGAASASAFSPVGAASPKSAARRQGGGARAVSPDSGRAAASLEPRVLMWGRREAAAEEATGADTASVPVRVASPPAAFDAGVFVCPEGAASAEEQAAVLPVVPPLPVQAVKSEAAPPRSDLAADVVAAVAHLQVVLADSEGADAAGSRLGADDWLMNSARQRVLVNQQLDRTLSTVAAAPSSQPKSFIQVRKSTSHHRILSSLPSAPPPSLPPSLAPIPQRIVSKTISRPKQSPQEQPPPAGTRSAAVLSDPRELLLAQLQGTFETTNSLTFSARCVLATRHLLRPKSAASTCES